jgi:hypothetical protein
LPFAIAETSFTRVGPGEQELRLPLDARARRRLKGTTDSSNLALEVGHPYRAQWGPDTQSRVLSAAGDYHFALAPWVIAMNTKAEIGSARLASIVKTHTDMRMRAFRVDTAWAFDRFTKPILKAYLSDVPAKDVDWSPATEIGVLLHPFVVYVGPVKDLRGLAALPAEKRRQVVRDLLSSSPKLSTVTWPAGSWLLALSGGEHTERAGWWDEMEPAEQDALLKECVTTIAQASALSEKPVGKVGALRLPRGGAHDGVVDPKTIDSMTAWTTFPVFGQVVDAGR